MPRQNQNYIPIPRSSPPVYLATKAEWDSLNEKLKRLDFLTMVVGVAALLIDQWNNKEVAYKEYIKTLDENRMLIQKFNINH